MFKFYSQLKLALSLTHSLSLKQKLRQLMLRLLKGNFAYLLFYLMNIVSLRVLVFFYALKCNKILKSFA